MSKNSKQLNKATLAKQFKMKKGPAKTTAKHGKVRTWHSASSPTFWRNKDKDVKKGTKTESEKSGDAFFRALAERTKKEARVRKMTATD